MKNVGLNSTRPGVSEEISRRYGAATIVTLREKFGDQFAVNIPAHAKLDDVLHKLDQSSLDLLKRDIKQER